MDEDEQKPKGSQRLVLVVDDEEGIRTVLRRHLLQLGYRVALAADGEEALELAERLEPAVIVTDIHMPGVDGHALLRRLGSLGLHSSVILMSGRGELDDAIGALRQGAVDYLKKPWTNAELNAALGRAIELFEALEDLKAPPTEPAGEGPAPRDPSDRRVDAAKLVEALAERGSGTLEVPPPSSALSRMRELARRPGAHIDAEVLGLLERDPVLAAAVSRVARQTTPAAGLEPDDFRTAAEAIGVDAVRSEVETIALRNVFPIGVPALRTLNARLRGFTLARALAMRGIAETSEPEVKLDLEECYRAGLWLDVGAMYFLSVLSETIQHRGVKIANLPAMTQAIATHHPAMGASILQRWGMSPEQVELTASHHLDPPARNASPLWCAAVLGSAIASRATGFGDPTGNRDLKPDLLARCAYTLGVGDTSLRRVTRLLDDRPGHFGAESTS
jgi:CheY-like chemotaxis protein